MKFPAPLFILIVLMISCNSPRQNSPVLKTDSIAKRDSGISVDDPNMDDPDMDGLEPTITCDSLENISTIMQQVKENDSYGFIRYDSTQTLVLHGHFISADSISTLVLVGGDSGPPCGTGCNMLLLYRCDSVASLVLSQNSGLFSEADVRDLDGDGVMEIITGFDWMNMGECASYFQVFDFKGGKSNLLFENSGFDYFGCGYGDENVKHYKNGDTIGLELKTDLIDPDHDHIYEVKEYRDYKIFTGGKTEDEVLKNAEHRLDTVMVKLKSK
jgi:hypothetical protein